MQSKEFKRLSTNIVHSTCSNVPKSQKDAVGGLSTILWQPLFCSFSPHVRGRGATPKAKFCHNKKSPQPAGAWKQNDHRSAKFSKNVMSFFTFLLSIRGRIWKCFQMKWVLPHGNLGSRNPCKNPLWPITAHTQGGLLHPAGRCPFNLDALTHSLSRDSNSISPFSFSLNSFTSFFLSSN